MIKSCDHLAIYVHWPFCKSKCPYCNFYKEIDKRIEQDILIDEYLEALSKYHELTSEHIIKSVFFGGGTPSLIKPQNIEKIINHIGALWKIDSQIEISLEANPNSHYHMLFQDLKSAGINRLSLGVQAFNDDDCIIL